MYEMYANGSTLQGVATEYGVTRERVRQIFKAAGLPNIPLSERTRRASKKRAQEIVCLFRELRDEREVATRVGLPRSVVREVLRAELPAGELRKATKHKKRYSDEELVSMLREASATLGGVLSKDAYERFARGRKLPDGRPWPTGQTHMLHFGTWRRAVEAAGLRANPSSPIAGQRLFDAGQCIDALRYAARELGKPPTAAAYDEIAQKSRGGLPSQATVRHRLGRWYEALAKAGL